AIFISIRDRAYVFMPRGFFATFSETLVESHRSKSQRLSGEAFVESHPCRKERDKDGASTLQKAFGSQDDRPLSRVMPRPSSRSSNTPALLQRGLPTSLCRRCV